MTKFLFSVITAIAIYIVVFQSGINQRFLCHAGELMDKFKQSDYNLSFERMERIRFSKQYMQYFEVVTFKYNRTSAVSNLTWSFKIDVGKKLEIVVQAYRFASNEYRLFPLRMQLNYYDAIEKDIIGLQNALKSPCGNSFAGCPILKNRVGGFCKWSPDPAHFPPNIPDGKYMVELQGTFDSNEMYVLHGYGTVFRPIAKK
ncbi:hypothetical protein ILUMI_21252 [Ignelater luminosus]|uniref:Uncharacterized protein n=1 Tax=Ignelater luminosus TaxID=2038154 RepID=A0A8K0CCT1_IGNLU|nr:hypothetical protein ILUMI_21252 [Ignelater luminosus]